MTSEGKFFRDISSAFYIDGDGIMESSYSQFKRITIAHDDAIRRECADEVKRLAIRNVNGSMIVNMDSAIAAILGTEPAREES